MGALKQKLIEENEKKIIFQPLWVDQKSDYSYKSKVKKKK